MCIKVDEDRSRSYRTISILKSINSGTKGSFKRGARRTVKLRARGTRNRSNRFVGFIFFLFFFSSFFRDAFTGLAIDAYSFHLARFRTDGWLSVNLWLRARRT